MNDKVVPISASVLFVALLVMMTCALVIPNNTQAPELLDETKMGELLISMCVIYAVYYGLALVLLNKVDAPMTRVIGLIPLILLIIASVKKFDGNYTKESNNTFVGLSLVGMILFAGSVALNSATKY